MPLSEHEQRLLEQIEQALYAEDPKFASSYRTKNLRRYYRVRILRAGVVFVVGLGLLLAGVVVKQPAIGVVGFLAMLTGTALAISAWQRLTGKRAATARAVASTNPPGTPRPARPRAGGRRSLLARLEERWQRRQDGNGR